MPIFNNIVTRLKNAQATITSAREMEERRFNAVYNEKLPANSHLVNKILRQAGLLSILGMRYILEQIRDGTPFIAVIGFTVLFFKQFNLGLTVTRVDGTEISNAALAQFGIAYTAAATVGSDIALGLPVSRVFEIHPGPTNTEGRLEREENPYTTLFSQGREQARGFFNGGIGAMHAVTAVIHRNAPRP